MMAAVAHVARACLLCWLRTLTPVQGFKNDTCGLMPVAKVAIYVLALCPSCSLCGMYDARHSTAGSTKGFESA